MSTTAAKDVVIKPTIADVTEEELKEFKRRYIETADRSFIDDRLRVTLPEHLHGEWIGKDEFSQFHARAKGFVDGREFLSEKNISHNSPDGPSVGDVMFMVIPKKKYLAMQEIDAITAKRRSGIDRDIAEEMYNTMAREIGLGIEPDRPSARIISNTSR